MNVNELVTRKKYRDDIVFRVIGFYKNKVLLRGEYLRLIADADEEDLNSYNKGNVQTLLLPKINEEMNLIKGTILHIDGDEYYLKKAMDAYSKYNIKAIGYYVSEKDLPFRIKELLNKNNPDILVLTGHDSLKVNEDKNNINSYKNSKYFIEAVQEVRSLRPCKDDLVVIAGACQSFFEGLIDAGANFASSPKRNNIHLLDPVIIASFVANSRINSQIDIEYILSNSISKNLGGIETKGKARKIYFGG